MDSAINENTIVVAEDQQVSGNLPDGNAVILNLNSGVYYGVNAVGERVWSLVQKPISFTELRDILMTEYDVDHNQCTEELKRLLQDMSAHGLIQIR